MGKELTPEAETALQKIADLGEKLKSLRLQEAAVWAEVKAAIKEAYKHPGVTYDAIAKRLHVTRARIYQLVTGKRSGK